MYRHPLFLPAAALFAFAALAAADTGAAATLALRLLPVLAFAASMSVVVNLAARVHLFEWLVARLERATSSREAAFAGFLALAAACTAFFSLDTTAIMLTPLAIQLATRFRLPQPAVAFAVVWIANLASMPLPVSNLTNLLALSGGAFDSQQHFRHAAQFPAAAAFAVAAAACYLARFAYRGAAGCAEHDNQHHYPRPGAAPLVLCATMLALLSPVPYWATSTVAAAAMWVAVGTDGRRGGVAPLIPWPALALAAALSAAATLCITASSVAGAVRHLQGAHPGLLAAAGAAAANAINNIPAYFALEPAAGDSLSTMALLIGVNAGPLVSPWASLATLLWADQLKRSGASVQWTHFALWGLAVAPLAVGSATVALLATA